MKIRLTLIFVLLLMGNALASPDISINKYSTGFSLLPYSLEQEVCSCGHITDKFLIKNTGSFEAEFTARNNLGLTQNFQLITLKPGQQALLELNGDLACETGELNYLVEVFSSHGTRRELSRISEVNKCQNLQLSTDDVEEIQPGTTFTKTVQIINIGSFTETYKLSSKSLNNYLENDSYQIILAPFSDAEIDFVYEFPPGFYGDYTFKFEGEAEINGLKAVLKDEFRILSDYNFSVHADEQTICKEINTPFNIYINNEGGVDNSYTIRRLSGRNYDLSANTIDIASGDRGEVIVTPNKNNPVEEILRLKIIAEYGNIDTIIKIPISVIACYDLYVELPQEINHCGGEKDYPILIKNTGLLEQEIVIQTEAGELSDETIFLDSDEEATIDLTISTADETTILVNSALGQKFYDIPTNTAELCIMQEVGQEYFLVRDSYAQLIIPITNTGRADGTFSLNVDNDATLSVSELDVPAGATKTVLLSVDLSNRDFGAYAFNLEIEGDMITEQTIVVDYQDKTLFQKGIIFLNNNICLYALGIMLLAAFVTLLMWIFIKPKGRGSTKLTVLIILVVLVSSAFTITLIKGTPQPLYPVLESEPSNLYYEVYQNEKLIIDVAGLFEDEDSDELTYQVFGDDLNYDLKDGFLAIKDVSGTYEIFFEAYDGEEYAGTPEVIIIIKEKPQIDFLQLLVTYCSWLTWLALLLTSIFFLGFIISLSGPKEKVVFDKPAFKGKKAVKKKVSKKKSAKKRGRPKKSTK